MRRLQKMLDNLGGLGVEFGVHPLHAEMQKIKELTGRSLASVAKDYRVGKHRLTVCGRLGDISVIQISDPVSFVSSSGSSSRLIFEMYGRGNLFTDVEQYISRVEVVRRIKELLLPPSEIIAASVRSVKL